MIRRLSHITILKVLGIIGFTAFLFLGTYGYIQEPREAAAKNSIDKLPLRGKLVQATPPRSAVFGMIYINTRDNREYIFDGAQWVPHDDSVDEFYLKKDKVKLEKAKRLQTARASGSGPIVSPNLELGEVLPTGTCDPSDATGAHEKHATFNCKTCHFVGGVLCFDIKGPAVPSGSIGADGNPIEGKPLPSFNVVTQTCSSVACHGVPAGTFSYYFPGGDGEPELNTVTYGGTMASETPSWYSTGVGCTACHDNPPRNGSSGSNVWHSGNHGGQGPTGVRNQCQFCHPDATGSGGQGTAITTPALHANGVVNVQARFTSACFGCH